MIFTFLVLEPRIVVFEQREKFRVLCLVIFVYWINFKIEELTELLLQELGRSTDFERAS